MPNLYSCLWFDHQAVEAMKFYTTVFKNSEIMQTVKYGREGAKLSGQKEGTVLTVLATLEDYEVMGLNGGPVFKFNPSMSLMVGCSSDVEIVEKWNKLSAGGTIRMGLDKYPWAEKYGWTTDKYGVEWQLILNPAPYKIAPAFLFVDALYGKGEEAINHWVSVLPQSHIVKMSKNEKDNTVQHCIFELSGQVMTLMEGAGKHGHEFNDSHSIVVECDTQNEIDQIYGALLKGGKEEQCGWVRDKYGVAWQVVPRGMRDWTSDPERSDRIMGAIGKMKKLDLETLKNA